MPKTPRQRLRPLRRVRQVREFTSDPVSREEVDAIADVARWSGSSRNEQPWRFVVVRDRATIAHIGQIGQPQTRGMPTAAAAIAVVLPDEPAREASRAFDDGRAVERMLIAAYELGLAGGVCTILPAIQPAVNALLAVPEGRSVRHIVFFGHPTEEARKAKSAPGEARRPRAEIVFEERWPEGQR